MRLVGPLTQVKGLMCYVAQREGLVKTRGQGSHLQAKARGLRGTSPAHTWISDFQALELQEIKFCCLHHPVCYLLLEIPRQSQRTMKDPRSHCDRAAELRFKLRLRLETT